MTAGLAIVWAVWLVGGACLRCGRPRRRRLPPGCSERVVPLGRPSSSTPRRGLVMLLALALGFLITPPAALLVPLAVRARPVLARRRAAREREAAIRSELPDVVDLLVLAVGAGLTIPLAVEAIARHHRGLLGEAFADVSHRTRLGARLADALGELPARLGELIRPLVAVLVSSERYGVPLLPALERLAHEGRDERRRHAETAARRLPVKLLFPLVLCTLPAFALLTVVSLLAGSLRELRL